MSGPKDHKNESVTLLPSLAAEQQNKKRLMRKGEQPQGGGVERK